MNMNKFAAQVHDNAVKHGWWESERPITETVSLIHSEWSEALEEYRAGRPMEYRICHEDPEEKAICNPKDEAECLNYGKEQTCKYYGAKPEGIAVELVDGCIRIMDLLSKSDYRFSCATMQELISRTQKANPLLTKETPLPQLVAVLHSLTAKAGDTYLGVTKAMNVQRGTAIQMALSPLEAAIGVAMHWVQANGIDAEAIIVRKHNFNLTRPYKHGKLC